MAWLCHAIMCISGDARLHRTKAEPAPNNMVRYTYIYAWLFCFADMQHMRNDFAEPRLFTVETSTRVACALPPARSSSIWRSIVSPWRPPHLKENHANNYVTLVGGYGALKGDALLPSASHGQNNSWNDLVENTMRARTRFLRLINIMACTLGSVPQLFFWCGHHGSPSGMQWAHTKKGRASFQWLMSFTDPIVK